VNEHAPLAPSSAPLWGNCSGAVHASAGRINETNARTIQGTAAHWVMEQCAKNWRSAEVEAALYCSDWVGEVDPDGTVITEEIAEGAQFILDDMLKVVGHYGGYSNLLIEQRVAMSQIHANNWGTLDIALHDPVKKVLYLWDYKHGYRLVRAKGNLQMIDYVAGLLETYALPMDTEVHIRIVQPFAYASWGAVDEHVCLLSDLVPSFQQLATKANEAYTNPTLSAGKWCRDCLGRVDCPAAREHTYLWGSICEMPYQMDRMAPDDKAREIDLLTGVISMAKARRDAMEDDLKASLSKGEHCVGKVYQTAKGARGWREGMKPAAIAAFQSIGVDITKIEALTPRQALMKAPKDKQAAAESILNGLAPHKLKSELVDSDDSLVARAFGNKPTKG
jgi:hypothetical protein